MADLGLALPPLLVRRILAELHRARPKGDLPQRLDALARAGRLFATGILDGETPRTRAPGSTGS
ncbi:hypothetical protein [Streptomyces sp. NPDC047974]|uniref:hypothetical protein n=1 Tax=Streptomyces sp. NPDC047974 TaxID=3154343 RepID=UPI0033C5064D